MSSLHPVIRRDIALDLIGHRDHLFEMAVGKLFFLYPQETLVIETQALPQPPPCPLLLPHSHQEAAMSTAAAAEDILGQKAPKADNTSHR